MIAAVFQWSFCLAMRADARLPLEPVAVEAEEVRRLHCGRGVPRARGAVDERLRRVLLGVVGDRDGLVTGERPDHDVGTELLHEPLGLLDRRVRRVVRATDAHELERMASDRAAVPTCGRLVRVVRLRAAELRDGGDRSADVLLVVRGERATAVGHDRELDRRRRRLAHGRGGRDPEDDCGAYDETRRKPRTAVLSF